MIAKKYCLKSQDDLLLEQEGEDEQKNRRISDHAINPEILSNRSNLPRYISC